MLTKIKAAFRAVLASRTGQVVGQAAAAFLVVGGGELVASGWLDVHHITDMTLVQKAAVAGLGAALAVVRSAVAVLVSGGQAVTVSDAYRYRRAAKTYIRGGRAG